MKKKKLSIVLSLIFIITSVLGNLSYADTSISAQKNESKLLVNGQAVSVDAYNINGNNYFKLRDVAIMLNNTERQFDVSWDEKNQQLEITTGKAYSSDMTLSNGGNKTKNAYFKLSNISLDGENIVLAAFNIDGNNYFKLRDLSEKIKFSSEWNQNLQAIEINSGNLTYDNTVNKAPNKEVSAIKPWDYAKKLGRGVDVDWSKTKDGRKYYNEKAVKDFKKAGVSHVRIRIADKADETLLKGLDEQIKDCIENGIIPVIAYQADEFKNNPNEKNIKEVIDWWTTVAQRYQDYSPLLSFDLLIEATDALNDKPEKLNEIYERLVTEIRKTNPERIIMISPRLRSDSQYLSELKIPTKHNGYLMAEWHFYAAGPSKTNERKLWTTGTEKEKQLIKEKIEYALKWQKETGIPTWVGAWMPGNYNDENDYSVKEQVVFAKYMTQQLSSAKIPFAVNSDTKFYDRENNKWISEMQSVFKAIFNS